MFTLCSEEGKESDEERGGDHLERVPSLLLEENLGRLLQPWLSVDLHWGEVGVGDLNSFALSNFDTFRQSRLDDSEMDHVPNRHHLMTSQSQGEGGERVSLPQGSHRWQRERSIASLLLTHPSSPSKEISTMTSLLPYLARSLSHPCTSSHSR
jgi:hypothetical protein